MDDDQESPPHIEHSRSSPKSAARRRRPPLSCTVCRRRKLKCDRALPCSQCIKSKTADQCIYVGPQAGSLSSFRRAEDRDTTVNDRARASTDRDHRGSPVYSGVYVFDSKHRPFPTRVAKPKSRSDEMQELRNRVLTLENALVKASSIQTPETLASIVSESGPRTTGDERYLSEDIRSLPWAFFRGKKTNTRYCGRSHSMLALSFFRDVVDFLRQRKSKHKKDSLKQFQKEMWLKQRQEPQQCVRQEQASSFVDLLPPRQVADELVHLYLSNFETTYRILHIPTFLKQYEDYWTAPQNPDMVFLAKLLLLMAASSCFYSPTTKINGKDSLASTAIHWIEAVQTWSTTSCATRNTNFDMLQVHCLSLTARQANAFDGDTIWISSGLLIRSAMTMGLHRNPSRFQKLSRFWAELRRRLWATILELDLQSSMDGGMPPTIDLEEYDCDPPSNYDDADLIENMSEDPPPKSPGILTRSSFQVLLSRTLPVRVHIAKLVNRLRFTISYDEALSLSEELMQSLNDALNLFPSDRSLSHIPGVENPAFTKSYFIFLIRRHLLALHRPFCLSIMQTPKFSYSRKICLDSALDMLSLLEAPLDVAEAGPHPHLGHLTGGMFREELFHAATMVCVELVLQADECSRSKSMLQGQNSLLDSLHDMAESQQAVMVHAVENAIKLFGSRIGPGGRGCKPYVFLSITLASVKARLKGEDSFKTMDQAGTNAIRDCHLLMSGVPWADVRKQDENSTKDASISTPGLTAGTPLDLPFDPMAFVPSSMEDISPLDFGTLFDMTDYGASEIWNNDFFSGL
ncbi:brefeldin A resistance protein [Aspergillus udagawae]|uniref:Brefeldin A resistance protein n=1 Tax=Aspergillus udagawae TaxID=91492 RepID=A0ABQ1B046_9EURO|nr:brefeldin A resistance protein [Aspergillus udagawae]GFG08530.1 brefeldin A resistance protein [Aspergillus udagawae]GFG23283.1 brefeldin A resistance protein [Aspergillus udagawae]